MLPLRIILALLLLPLAGCNLRQQAPRAPSRLATVAIDEIKDQDYTKVQLRVWEHQTSGSSDAPPVIDEQVGKGFGSLARTLKPGTYRFRIDYVKDQRRILTSQDCDGNGTYTLQAGANPITIYVCSTNGQRFPPGAAACDDSKPALGKRRLRLLSAAEYQATMQDLTGITTDLTGDFPKQTKSREGFDNLSDQMVVTDSHASAYYEAADRAASFLVGRGVASNDCKRNEAACAKDYIATFGKRAWRGPLSDADVARVLQVFNTGRGLGNYDDGIKLAITAMLISPRFLYRYEVGTAKGDHYELSSWEMAQALSYMYWGTMPDEALFKLAEKDELKKPEVIAREAKRLLTNARSRQMTAKFAQTWLGTDGVLSVNKDTGLYPEFNSDLRQKLLSETSNFFNDVVFNRNGKFSDLFDANYTIGDQQLAQYYGGNLSGNRVTYNGNDRRGLLGHASILATYAEAAESSPIRRGVYVYDHLLCQPLPPPPPELQVQPPPRDDKATTRERFAVHSSAAQCAGCHRMIDGVGFGMEDMDAVGKFRSLEHNRPVDASGNLASIDNKDTPFRGTAALGALVASSPTARACFSKQALRFAAGRIETTADACAVRDLYEDFSANDFNLQTVFLKIPLHDSFRKRQN